MTYSASTSSVSRSRAKKTQSDLKPALEYTIARFGNFEELFTDTEGGLQSRTVVRLLNEHNIHHISTYGKSPFAEKAIHSLKTMIHNRLDGLKMDKTEWVSLLPKVIDKYNNRTIHSTIKMTPADATQDSNTNQVWIHIRQKARYNKLYDKLGKGDIVRTAIPKKTFTKDHHPKFSTQVYTVTHVGKDGGYLIDNPNHKRVWLRHELRLVKAVEDKDS